MSFDPVGPCGPLLRSPLAGGPGRGSGGACARGHVDEVFPPGVEGMRRGSRAAATRSYASPR